MKCIAGPGHPHPQQSSVRTARYLKAVIRFQISIHALTPIGIGAGDIVGRAIGGRLAQLPNHLRRDQRIGHRDRHAECVNTVAIFRAGRRHLFAAQLARAKANFWSSCGLASAVAKNASERPKSADDKRASFFITTPPTLRVECARAMERSISGT
jgi:hypothetical protein